MTPNYCLVQKFLFNLQKKNLMWEDIVSGAGSFLGGLFGLGAQSSANEANKELAEYAYEKNLDLWNRQNAYNAPTQQMERLRAAGLNPNLVYGSGVTGNNSGSVPSYNAPNIAPVTQGGFVSDAVQKGLWTKAQLDNLSTQTELSSTQQQVAEANIAKISADTARTVQDTARSKFDLDLATELRRNSIDVANANLDKVRASAEGQQIMNAYNKARTELIPLQARLTEAQIENVAVAAAEASWTLRQEQHGRFTGKDFMSNLANQVIRWLNDDPSMFDNIGKLRDKILQVDVPKRWYESNEGYYKRNSKGSGTR